MAIKVERTNSSMQSLHGAEVKTIQIFQYFKGFPRLLDAGVSTKSEIKYAVVDLLGPSLGDLLELCGYRFSLKTTLMLWY